MRRAGIAVLALLAGSGGIAAAQEPEAPVAPAAPQGAIDVRSAQYGRAESVELCSALDRVRLACQGRAECTLAVTPDLCPGSNVPDVLIPRLIVTFRCHETDTKPRQVTAERPFALRVSCLHG